MSSSADAAGFITLTVEAYLVVVAMLVGSFINLAVDRAPRGESLVRPRSHCRACGRVLNTIDLLPVAGYLVRGGRCATCRAPIGVASPLVEAAAGACMLLALVRLGLWPGLLAGFLLVALVGVTLVGLALARRRSAAPS
jgi:prepilin signal peptidase PulO-like enzyme (type II secretory pathway)